MSNPTQPEIPPFLHSYVPSSYLPHQSLKGSISLEPRFAGARPLAQDYTVIHRNLDLKRYVEGPGLARFEDGRLVAVVPEVPRVAWSDQRTDHSVIYIVGSQDGGKTWERLSAVPGSWYSAVPWVHEGDLYLFLMKPQAKQVEEDVDETEVEGGQRYHYRNRDLLLVKSSDGGKTWSEPVRLFKGHYWNCHTGMVIRDGRLYWAIDDISPGMDRRGPVIVSGDLTGDVMDPSRWRLSNPVHFPGFPEQFRPEKYARLWSQYIEPNVIEFQGRIRVLATVKPHRSSVGGVCAVFDFEDDDQGGKLKFAHYNAMPGAHIKFSVVWDEESGLFWATSNLSADTQGHFDWWEEGEKQGYYRGEGRIGGSDRRFLYLWYSLEGLNWFPAGCVAQAAKISQSFMYSRLVVDGDDLAIISRSNINGPNQHDADTATFHRVKDFRKLALNLRPEPESATD